MFDQLFDSPPTLSGTLVRMEPLGPQHAEPLWEAAGDARIWTWMPLDARAGRSVWERVFEDALARTRSRQEFAFATVDVESGRPIGSSRYLSLRPEHRGLEIGWTWLSPAAWRSGANVEAKLLMMEHAFDALGCMRVEFKTDARNDRSRAALEALPATFEGIFRKHMLVRQGAVRDSAYYAVTDDDWPAVRENLRQRLRVSATRRPG